MPKSVVDTLNAKAPKPDWILSRLGGTVSDKSDKIHAQGLRVTDFDFKDAAIYWGLDKVKSMFGNDKTTFDKFYTQSVGKFSEMASNELLEKNYLTGGRSALMERAGYYAPSPKVTKSAPDPWGRTFNSMQTVGGGWSPKQRGIRETAAQRGVKMDDGSYVPIKNYNGLTRFARETDGSWSMDDTGSPYMTPVGEGEELAGWDEVYNPLSEWMGYYGHDYSGSMILSSIPKNALNFVSNTLDALAEFPKAFLSLTDQDGGEFYNKIVSGENWAKSFRIPQTERGQESFFSLEGLTDLAQQVVYQLGAMVATGGSIGALSGSQALGSMAGKLFMTGLAAGDIAEVARDNGLTNKEASVILGLTAAAFYPLMGLSEAAIGMLNLQNSKAAMTHVVGQFMKVLPKNKPSSWRAAFLNARSDAKDMLFKASVAGEGNALVGMGAGAGLEAAEEVSEQIVDLGVRNLYNFYNNNVDDSSPTAKWLNTDKDNNFHIDWVEEAKLMGYSAVGGAMGGAIANRMFRMMGMKNPSLKRSFWDSVSDGNEKILKDHISQLHKDERLGEEWLDENYNFKMEGGVSRNDAAKNVLDGMVDWMVEMRDNQEVNRMIPNNRLKLDNLKIMFTNLDKAQEDEIDASLVFSSLGKDAANLSSDIVELDGRITEKQASPVGNTEEVKELSEKRDLKQDQLKRIVSGNAVGDYVAQGLYTLRAISRADIDLLAKKLNGKQFVNLSRLYSTTLDNLNEQFTSDTKVFNERDSAATIENLPNALGKETKEKLETEAVTALEQSVNSLASTLETEETFDTELFQQQVTERINTDALSETFGDHILNTPFRNDERFQEVIQSFTDLQAVRKVPIEEAPLEPNTTEPLMTMVNITDGEHGKEVVPTRISIQKRIDDELDTRKKQTSNGVSLYTGEDRLIEIQRSIETRTAQLKMLPEIEPLTTPIYERLGQEPLPQIPADTINGLQGTLQGQSELVDGLLREARHNERNRDVAIRKATIAKLSQEALIATDVAHTVADKLPELKGIINSYTEPLQEALEEGDITGFFSQQRQMESEIFDKYSAEIKSVLILLTPSDEVTLQDLVGGKHDGMIKQYNYMRRVLGLKANDFWLVYDEVLQLSKRDSPPSGEQLLVIKQAVQSAMSNVYAPTWMRKHPQYTNHSDSVVILGDGGTGKTSQVAPLVVASLQKLVGKKVFITSKHLKDDKSKVANIEEAIRGYFDEKSPNAVLFKDSTKSILEFLQDSNEIIDTSVIVYDEATLLTGRELALIQEEVKRINRLRGEAGEEHRLKIIYLADLKQNSADVESQISLAKSDVDTAAGGFDQHYKHLADKTDVLNYSFRIQNMPLKVITSYLGDIQNQVGKSEPIQTEFKAGKGVNVINDYDSFVTHARNTIDRLNREGKKVVYVTDKSRTELPEKIRTATVDILSPINVQGLEWDTVIVDLKDDALFAENTRNMATKRAYYTAATRAGNYLVMHLSPSTGIKSAEGPVTRFEPLSEETNLENHLSQVSEILGSSSGEELSVRPPTKQPTGDGQTTTTTETTTKTTEEEGVIKAPEGTEQSTVQSIIEKLSPRTDWITGFTFFTPTRPGDADALQNALWTKRKALYNPSPDFKYNLVIARNGSPEYTTVIARNPDLEGGYVMAIEADTGRGSETIAVLPGFQRDEKGKIVKGADTLDDMVTGLLGDIDVVRIDLDPTVMNITRRKNPVVKRTDHLVTYEKMREDSQPGMVYGTPRIIFDDYIMDGRKQHRKGDVVVPVTFMDMSSEELDALSNNNTNTPDNVTFINMTRTRLPFETFLRDMSDRFYDEAKGFDWMNKDFKAQYNSFWGHYTKHSFIAKDGSKKTYNLLAAVFAEIANKTNDPVYKEFLNFYAFGATPSSQKLSAAQQAKSNEASAAVADTDAAKKVLAEEKHKSYNGGSQAYYFPAHYSYILKGDRNLVKRDARFFDASLFQRAINDFKRYKDSTFKDNQNSFGDGLLFTPDRGLKGNRGKQGSWHSQAWKMPEVYDNFLRKNGFATLPQPQFQRNSLLNAIGTAASVQVGNIPSETGESVKTNGTSSTSDLSSEYDDSNKVLVDSAINKKSTLLDFYTTWYNRRPERMIKATDKFRRGLYNKIFDFQNGNINSVDTAVKAYKQDINQQAGRALAAGMDEKTVQRMVDDNPELEDLADALAINSSLDFLINHYFPTIQLVNGAFNFRVSLLKQEGFYDNESLSYLHEGMNEMVTTQLLNTPVVEEKDGRFRMRTDSKGNTTYLARNDIEDMVAIARGARTREEFIEALQKTSDPKLKSLYIRFFSPSVTNIRLSSGPDAGTTIVRSMAQMNHSDAGKIVNSLHAFLRSAEIFNLSSVNLLKEGVKYRGFPIAASRPNIVREEVFTALKTKADTISNDVITYTDKVIISGESFLSPGTKLPTEEDILSGMDALGISFGADALNYLYKNPELTTSRDESQHEQEQLARNELMEKIIFPLAREIQQGSGERITSHTNRMENLVFIPIIESANINYLIRQKNIDGNMVERLRKSVPILRFDERIASLPEGGILSDNLVVNKTYEVRNIFLKEGFKRTIRGRNRSRSSTNMTMEETADLDILYGFANILKQTDGTYAAFPIQVYSDSPSDMTVIVSTDKGFFRKPDAIYGDVFDYRSSYYRKMDEEIATRWSYVLDKSFNTASQVDSYIRSKKLKVSSIEGNEGFIKGVVYDDRVSDARIKPELLEEIKLYTEGTKDAFLTQMNAKADRLIRLANSSMSSDTNRSLTGRLKTQKHSGEDMLRMFHANWLAVSGSFLDLMAGPRFQYKSKIDDASIESSEYLDYVKRAKSNVSSRSLFIHRDEGWTSEGDLTEAQMEEGRKLPGRIKIAYVKDIEEKVLLATKNTTQNQEIYDGATFVLPLARLMQSASLGGNYGLGTPPVMKNITDSWDEHLGTKIFVKHAEFLLTPEIIRQGTDRTVGIVKKMLNQPFTQSYDMEGTTVKSAWETLLVMVNGDAKNESLKAIEADTVDEDGNSVPGHFTQLLDTLVQWGQQDTPIMEVIPSTAIKTGRGAINSIDGSSWTSESLDISNKGIQLDASKEAGREHTIKVLTQMVSAAVINWKNPSAIDMLLGSLSTYTQRILKKHSSDEEFINTLRGWVNNSLLKASNLSYQHILASRDKSYSLDNPQIMESVFITLSNVLSQGHEGTIGNVKYNDMDAAIMPLFTGNHYVVHPQRGLVKIFDVNRDGVIIPMLEDAIQEGDDIVRERDHLKWNDPIKVIDGQVRTFTELLAETDDKQALRDSLSDGTWEPGEAEILLPADMGEKFFMKDLAVELGRPIQTTDVTPEYLVRKITERESSKTLPKTPEQILGEAELMFASYRMRLSGLTTRIPATGKHSAVNTTIVGFMHESANAVFAPIEILSVQGADQDIDKGEHITYEVVNGKVYFTDETFTSLLKGDEYKQLISDQTGIPIENLANANTEFKDTQRAMRAALKNNVVLALRTIIGSPDNTLEVSTTVDDALNQLRPFADEAKKELRLSRDDYESMVQMHQDNQAGTQLVGPFANGHKAYQIIYGAVRQDDNPPASTQNIAGIFDETNEISLRFAAITNAAVDNGNEQILGSLGVNLENANMVSFMIASGKSWDEINGFLNSEQNKKDLNQLYLSQRYDSKKTFFDASVWLKTNPVLYEMFKKGEEYGLLSMSIINRKLPAGSFKLFSFRNRIESFVNNNTNITKFNFARFTNPEEASYRNTMINLYEEAIANNPDSMATNILYVLGRSTHIAAYNSVYSFAENFMQNNSKVYNASSKIGKAVEFVSEGEWRSISNFVYGSVIHEYLNSYGVKANDFDLGTPSGRTDFVKWFNDSFVPELKRTHRDNSFVQMLEPSTEAKYEAPDAIRYRVHDVFQMDEEIALRAKADFDRLGEVDNDARGLFALYGLIVDKGKVRKGSFVQFFDPSEGHISKFNAFMRQPSLEIKVGLPEYQEFSDNKVFKDNPGLYHNAIPYGNTDQISQQVETERAEAERSKAQSPEDVLPNLFVDLLNSFIPVRTRIPYGATLETEVSVHTGGRPTKKLVKELPEYYLNRTELIQGEFEKNNMIKMRSIFDSINAPSNEQTQKRTEQCELPTGFKRVANKWEIDIS